MNAQTEIAQIGHNNPPDPIETVIAEYDAVLTEAQNWADGGPVTDRAGMEAVDAILKDFKAYRSALTKAGNDRTGPLHKAWKAAVAGVKVYDNDADLMQRALVAVVAPFKAKLAAEQEAQKRAAWEAAQKAQREADAKAAALNTADIDAQREVAASRQDALDAEKAARAQSKDTVKGMRTVWHHEITDQRAAINWIARNDRDAMAAFLSEYVRRNFRDAEIEGVNKWSTKEAF